ncbi:hypothetical protein ACJ2A9_03930 [Anaerobacillus sp. MEB173]|uniref:hypothetical protein n=1 Tax=Anaerobacillus sp. MEB173 TaxID=3383345 RepID=UPI003F8E2164
MGTEKELLERVEEIYTNLKEDCFTYVGTIVYDEAMIETKQLQELMNVIDELELYQFFSNTLLQNIREMIDVPSKIYLFSMYFDKNLNDRQNINDIRRKQIENVSSDLRRLELLLEELVFNYSRNENAV